MLQHEHGHEHFYFLTKAKIQYNCLYRNYMLEWNI